MSSKYCSSCTQNRLLSCFLQDASNPASKVLATCASCRASNARYSKRKALQPLDPNIQAKRRSTAYKSTYTSESFHPPSQSCRITSGSHYPSSQSTRITSGSPYPYTYTPSCTTSNSGLPACRSMAVYTELSCCNG